MMYVTASALLMSLGSMLAVLGSEHRNLLCPKDMGNSCNCKTMLTPFDQIPQSVVECKATRDNEIPRMPRGQVDMIQIGNANVHRIQAAAFPSLVTTYMSIFGNAISSVHGEAFRAAPRSTKSSQPLLQGLFLYRNQIPRLAVGTFDSLHSLTILNLNDNNLTELAVGVVSTLARLEMLYISNNPVTRLPAGFAPSGLRTLELRDTRLTHFDSSCIQGIRALQDLILPLNVTIAPDAFTAVRSSLNTVEVGYLRCSCMLWWYEHTSLQEELMCDEFQDIVTYLYKNCVSTIVGPPPNGLRGNGSFVDNVKQYYISGAHATTTATTASFWSHRVLVATVAVLTALRWSTVE